MGRNQSGSAKGRKKISGRSMGQSGANSSSDGKLDSCEDEVTVGNVNKVKKGRSKIPVAEKRGFQSSPGSRYGKKMKKNRVTEVDETLTANFEENGEEVQFKLTANQANEFNSETDEGDSSDNDEPQTMIESHGMKQNEIDDDVDSEVVILKKKQTESDVQEEKEMMKFVEFM